MIQAQIQLSNPRDPALKPLQVDALADSGALHLCVPEHIAVQLQEIYKREVTTADGKAQKNRTSLAARPMHLQPTPRRE